MKASLFTAIFPELTHTKWSEGFQTSSTACDTAMAYRREYCSVIFLIIWWWRVYIQNLNPEPVYVGRYHITWEHKTITLFPGKRKKRKRNNNFSGSSAQLLKSRQWGNSVAYIPFYFFHSHFNVNNIPSKRTPNTLTRATSVQTKNTFIRCRISVKEEFWKAFF